MKVVSVKFVIILYFFSISSSLFSQSDSVDSDERMNWWREAKFGMFIHWGIYAVFENVYDGVNVRGEQVHYDMWNSMTPSEWIMYHVLIPRDIYREAAKQFDAKEHIVDVSDLMADIYFVTGKNFKYKVIILNTLR